MINYTTKWARFKGDEKAWVEWVSSLKSGDQCIFQQFVPRGNHCLDSQYEHWRFWPATYHGDRVFYYRESHPFKDGRAVYWNTNDFNGEVFGDRIVPCHGDIESRPEHNFTCGHAPVFEPNWASGARSLVLLHHKHFPNSRLKDVFPYCYHRKVEQGYLYTVFGHEDEIKERLPEEFHFLYSERFD
jgi:hypothetical protein